MAAFLVSTTGQGSPAVSTGVVGELAQNSDDSLVGDAGIIPAGQKSLERLRALRVED